MKSVTYKHTLSGDWDEIIVQDKNGSKVNFRGASVFFSSNIYIRGKEGEAEVLIESKLSPMSLEGAGMGGFPLEVKGTGILTIITIN